MLTNVLLVDVETAPREDARRWVTPDSRLTDPKKIAASLAERYDKLAVDINGAQIATLGYWPSRLSEPIVVHCPTPETERSALEAFWSEAELAKRHGTLAGFYARTFDLPLLIRRAQILGVRVPTISLARYHKGDVFDLYDELTFHEGHYGGGVVPRTLKVFCEQFGIDVGEDCDGADVPALLAAGEWEAVMQHNRADLLRTAALGNRIRVWDRPLPVACEVC